MPVWLIGLIIAALGGGGALVFFGGFGGSSDSKSDGWTAEKCNTRLEADVANFEKYQVNYAKIMKIMETDARSGNTANAETNKKNAESWKESTRILLKIDDEEIIPDCGREVFRPELLEKVEAARRFLGGDAPQAVKEEGMPDVRVTSIASTFIPYETDERGECSGPYLDLVFTVTNYGADFPRPVDVQTYEERAQRPSNELEFLMVTGELDFGGEMKKRLDFEIKGDKGRILSGGTLQIPAKVKVEHNQTHVRIKGSLMGYAFVKTGTEGKPPYEMEVDIPIWDIYAESHSAIDGIDPDTKQYYISGKAVVSNKGKTPTPGPIEGSFMINEIDPHRRISSWRGQTSGPVSGNAEIYARTDSDLKLPTDFTVSSSIIVMCPNGKVGNLSDGDTTNNIRDLQQR